MLFGGVLVVGCFVQASFSGCGSGIRVGIGIAVPWLGGLGAGILTMLVNEW